MFLELLHSFFELQLEFRLHLQSLSHCLVLHNSCPVLRDYAAQTQESKFKVLVILQMSLENNRVLISTS